MQRNSWRIFLGQKKADGPRKHLGGGSRGAAPTRARQEAQACPGECCPPWAPPEPPLLPINSKILQTP